MRNYAKRRRIKRYVVVTVLASILAYGAIFYLWKYKQDTAIAKINGEKIYQSEIAGRISDVLVGSGDFKMPQINELPKDVIEAFAKEIYLEKKLVKMAKKAGVDSSSKVEGQIKAAKNRILIDSFIEKKIAENTSEEKIQQKYVELSSKMQGKKEYLLSHIVTESQKDAQYVYRIYNETSPSRKPRVFADLAKKYSIDKQTANNSGELGYVVEDDIIKEIADAVLPIKKFGYTQPIETEFGWQVVRVQDVREVMILSFEEEREALKNQIVKETMSEIYQEVFGDAKIDLYLPEPEKAQEEGAVVDVVETAVEVEEDKK